MLAGSHTFAGSGISQFRQANSVSFPPAQPQSGLSRVSSGATSETFGIARFSSSSNSSIGMMGSSADGLARSSSSAFFGSAGGASQQTFSMNGISRPPMQSFTKSAAPATCEDE